MDNSGTYSDSRRIVAYLLCRPSTGPSPSGRHSIGFNWARTDRDGRRHSSAEAMPTSSCQGMRSGYRGCGARSAARLSLEDLSAVLPVMLGCWTEPFNRQWFEQASRASGSAAVGEHDLPEARSWRRCTLDGVVEASGASGKPSTPAPLRSGRGARALHAQLQHNMAVAGAERAVLSVIFGNHKYEMIEVAVDWLYQLELLEAEEEFWDCVQTGREPVPVMPPPPPADRHARGLPRRQQCLGFSSVRLAGAPRGREGACLRSHLIKSLVEEDVARAFGHGIEAKRSKSGAITIRELAQ